MEMEMLKFMKEVTKKQNEKLKEAFKGIIKGNFLIQMKYQIETDQRYLDLINKWTPWGFDITEMGLDNENHTYELCKAIAMVHRHNVELDDDYTRRKKEESIEYKKELTEEIFKMLEYKEMSNRTNRYDASESYNPINYYLYVGTQMLIDKIKDTKYKYGMKRVNQDNCISLLYSIQSILILQGNDHLADGIRLLRTIIELYAKTCAINDDETAERYFKFNWWHDLYNENGNFHKDFEELYEKENSRHLETINKIRFLHYGWIKKTDITIGTGRSAYSVNDVLRIVSRKYPKENIGLFLERSYSYTSMYIHGNPIDNYIQTSQYVLYWVKENLSKIFIKVYDRIKEVFDIELDDNEIYVIEKIKMLCKICEDRRKLYDNEEMEKVKNAKKSIIKHSHTTTIK